jgi:DNA repair photolyase
LDILDGKESVQEWGVVNGKREVIGNVSGKDFAGLYLITKHDGLPMEKLLETKIPKLIHFSITGLGGTQYEPGVMKPDDLLDRIGDYIKMGLDPNSVTIRIDPIVPGVTTPNMIKNIIRRASEMGIKRIRFSIMDAYPNTVESLSKIGYDFETHYGINPKTGKPNFNAKDTTINRIVDFML